MTDKEWLTKLAVGDKVIVARGTYDSIEMVTRVTSTQLVIGKNEKFNRTRGTSIGSSTWNHSWLEQYTPEKDYVIKLKALRSTVVAACRNVKRSDVEALNQAQCKNLLEMLSQYGLRHKEIL